MRRFPTAALVLACVAACGRSPDPPTAPSAAPSIPNAPASPIVVQSVEVRTPAGLSPAFTVGQRLQFAATARLSDGRTEDCTGSATWTTSDTQLVQTTGRSGEMLMLAFGEATISAACSGVTGELALSVRRGIRIEGLESYVPFMLPSDAQQLTALVVDGPGRTRDCTDEAIWTSSNSDVAWLKTHDTGYVMAGQSGEAVVSASCEGTTGSVVVRVDRYEIVVQLTDAESGAPVPDASVSPFYGRVTDAAGRVVAQGYQPSHTLSFWKLGYDPATHTVSWNRTPRVSESYALAPVPGIFEQGSARICGTPQRACSAADIPNVGVHAFTVPRSGTLRVDTIWLPGGTNDTLSYELLCNGAIVRSATAFGSLRGRWSEVAASTDCAYEFRVSQNYSGSTSYSYAFSVR